MSRLIDADKIVYSWLIDADGQEHDGVTLQSIIKKMPTIEPDRSLRLRISEICADESKGFISPGRAFEKIRELLREEERREDEQYTF